VRRREIRVLVRIAAAAVTAMKAKKTAPTRRSIPNHPPPNPSQNQKMMKQKRTLPPLPIRTSKSPSPLGNAISRKRSDPSCCQNPMLIVILLTPFQKYLEKRKERRREHKQAARGAKQNNISKDDDLEEEEDGDSEDGGMYEVDPEFGVAQFSDEEGIADDTTTPSGTADGNDTDGFFVGETTSTKSETLTKKKGKKNKKQTSDGEEDGDKVAASTKEELELLIAGDDDEEHEKDYDMRGLVKLQKLNSKTKLKGKRKRQLETLAANISGQEFHVDTSDDRFAALLDGNDDRFGIDRTHSAYRETGAMKTLLQEQSERRRKKKKNEKDGDDDDRGGNSVVKNKKDGGGGWVENSSGAMDLSSLVKSLQQKVSKSGNGSKRKKKEKV